MSTEVAAAAPVVNAGQAAQPQTTAAPIAVNPGPASVSAPVPTPSSPDWTQGFDDDLKGFVQNKGYQGPKDVLDSYRNLEKLIGAPPERVLKIPAKEDAPEWNEIYTKLGRPVEAKEYKIETKDENFGKWAQGTFHELGLSKKQGETLAKKFADMQQGMLDELTQTHNSKFIQENEGLKKEWGAAYEANVGQGKRAAKEFGIDGGTIEKIESALGFAGTMKLFQNIGSKLGEDSFVSAQGGQGHFGPLTPEAAKNKINALRGDGDFVRRYTAGEGSAIAEMNKLHEWAYNN